MLPNWKTGSKRTKQISIAWLTAAVIAETVLAEQVNKAPPFLARGLKREDTGNPKLVGKSWRGRNS